MRPRIFDAFPFAGTDTELLLLECRLTELYDVVDAFIIVEAEVDHQDHPKPLHYLEHQDRYTSWKDKITYVVAEDMPTRDDESFVPRPDATIDNWSWAREHAQRESIGLGLTELDPHPDDILMQSDADEIPRAVVARNLKLRDAQRVSLRQNPHYWAIDWLDPNGWSGTVATRVGNIRSLAYGTAGPFAMMRNSRNTNTIQIPNGGWHFSWLGKAEAAKRKIGSFCHPEVVDQIVEDLDWYWREGYHLGGGENGRPVKMLPVDVDKSYPKWMQDPANVPASWLRPR